MSTTTEVTNVKYIDRGYENFVPKLRSLGGQVVRQSSNVETSAYSATRIKGEVGEEKWIGAQSSVSIATRFLEAYPSQRSNRVALSISLHATELCAPRPSDKQRQPRCAPPHCVC